MQKSSKRKIKLILAASLVMILLLFPIKLTYKDGGTTTYNAVLYKVIVWNILDRNKPSGYLRGWEFHLFPNNFHDLKYYEDITFPDRGMDPIQENDDSQIHQNDSDIVPFYLA